MSASLVGSEMCIRDRSMLLALPLLLSLLTLSLWQWLPASAACAASAANAAGAASAASAASAATVARAA
eukprot:12380529-Alexandrium_andersonii.AAC.1